MKILFIFKNILNRRIHPQSWFQDFRNNHQFIRFSFLFDMTIYGMCVCASFLMIFMPIRLPFIYFGFETDLNVMYLHMCFVHLFPLLIQCSVLILFLSSYISHFLCIFHFLYRHYLIQQYSTITSCKFEFFYKIFRFFRCLRKLAINSVQPFKIIPL